MTSLEQNKRDYEACNDWRNDEHERLHQDENYHVKFGEAHHSHDSQVKTLPFDGKHEQWVDQQHWDEEEEQHDQVEDQLQEGQSDVRKFEILQNERFHGDGEETERIFHKFHVVHYVGHNHVKGLKVVILARIWQI